MSQSRESNNTQSCGSIDEPCRTISFAVEFIAQSTNVVMVDGGCGFYTYQFNGTVFVNKFLNITSWKRHVCEDTPGSTDPYKVKVSRENLSDEPFFKLEESFEISMFGFTNGVVFITTNNSMCSIRITVKDTSFTGFNQLIAEFNQLASLVLERCNFSLTTSLLKRINKTIVYQNGNLSGNEYSVKLKSCLLDSRTIFLPEFVGLFTSFEMDECIVKDTTVTLPFGACTRCTFTVRNSKFTRSKLNLNDGWNTIFDNNIFINCHELTICSSNDTRISNSFLDCSEICYLEAWQETHRITPLNYILLENVTFLAHSQISISLNGDMVTLNNVTFTDRRKTWTYVTVNHMIITPSISSSVELMKKEEEEENSMMLQIDLASQPVKNIFSFSCSQSHQIYSAVKTEFTVVICTPISQRLYSLSESTLEYDQGTQIMKITESKTQLCPRGAICGDGRILNKEIFWGQEFGDDVLSNRTLEFTFCPSLYCGPMSNEDEVSGYNLCNGDRQGILCGDCADGFTFPLIGFGCVEQEDCETGITYAIYLILPFLLVTVYLYLLPLLNWIIKRTRIKKRQRVKSAEIDRNENNEGNL